MIVDKVGYLPLEPSGANLFFQLVNVRYEKGAMILTSNRGFRGWGEVFGDNVIAAALLDRLLHHAIVIEIDGLSYRCAEHAHLIPEALHPTPVSTPPKRRRGRPRKTEVPRHSPADHRLHRYAGWGILLRQKWGDLLRY